MKTLAQSDIWRFNQVMRPVPALPESSNSRVLSRFQQVFPFAFFPDELIVEELRIVWVQNNGFWSKQIISIMVTDIACVYAASGPFFGSIHVKNLTGGPEIYMGNLHRDDVFRVRSLIEGIALASREGLKIENTNLQTERQNLQMAGAIN